ncbi:unnamed protein product [Parnassius apollo]|uniref:(apollo) hypothetical protein n=1 Tax=Parnassius apollo TaxID=110799 RepID=A0A8S3XFR2_PARAO|nr:unnamed protein product [Parnassius apollo]
MPAHHGLEVRQLLWHAARAAPQRVALLWSGAPVACEPLLVDVMPAHHGQKVRQLLWHAAPPRRTASRCCGAARCWSGAPVAREPLLVDVMPAHHGQEVESTAVPPGPHRVALL